MLIKPIFLRICCATFVTFVYLSRIQDLKITNVICITGSFLIDHWMNESTFFQHHLHVRYEFPPLLVEKFPPLLIESYWQCLIQDVKAEICSDDIIPETTELIYHHRVFTSQVVMIHWWVCHIPQVQFLNNFTQNTENSDWMVNHI